MGTLHLVCVAAGAADALRYAAPGDTILLLVDVTAELAATIAPELVGDSQRIVTLQGPGAPRAPTSIDATEFVALAAAAERVVSWS
jgi:hypothetical protein